MLGENNLDKLDYLKAYALYHQRRNCRVIVHQFLQVSTCKAPSREMECVFPYLCILVWFVKSATPKSPCPSSFPALNWNFKVFGSIPYTPNYKCLLSLSPLKCPIICHRVSRCIPHMAGQVALWLGRPPAPSMTRLGLPGVGKALAASNFVALVLAELVRQRRPSCSGVF